jgi:hypothetical protein
MIARAAVVKTADKVRGLGNPACLGRQVPVADKSASIVVLMPMAAFVAAKTGAGLQHQPGVFLRDFLAAPGGFRSRDFDRIRRRFLRKQFFRRGRHCHSRCHNAKQKPAPRIYGVIINPGHGESFGKSRLDCIYK